MRARAARTRGFGDVDDRAPHRSNTIHENAFFPLRIFADYRRRYDAYALRAADAIRAGHAGIINVSAYLEDLTVIAADWTLSSAPASVYPSEPVGDAVAKSAELYAKYARGANQ